MASAAPIAVAFKVSVDFERREDGGLRAYSNDVPGFVLSHRDCDAVLGEVVPVLETILSDMFNKPIRVKELHDVRESLEDAGVIARKARTAKKTAARNVPTPGRREYVTELAA
jgi:hypothetical protein